MITEVTLRTSDNDIELPTKSTTDKVGVAVSTQLMRPTAIGGIQKFHNLLRLDNGGYLRVESISEDYSNI